MEETMLRGLNLGELEVKLTGGPFLYPRILIRNKNGYRVEIDGSRCKLPAVPGKYHVVITVSREEGGMERPRIAQKHVKVKAGETTEVPLAGLLQ